MVVVLFGISVSSSVSANAVNDYISKNNIQPASETLSLGRIYNQDPKKNGGFNMDFSGGKPRMVIIHDVGVDGGSINGSIDYMVGRTQDSAFVHSFVDDSRLITIADKSKKSWGSGAWGNQYGIQIEQMRVTTSAAFYREIATLAKWTADQLITYGMGEPKLISSPNTPQKNNLSQSPDGNLASHKMIAYKYNQTTNHVDPDEYWSRFGYDMSQFRDLVSYYYSNFGSLDYLATSGEGATISVRGWYFNRNKYEFLFVMDANTGREISRYQVKTPTIRQDVEKVLGIAGSAVSGFDAQISVPTGRNIFIMSRKTNDPLGNTNGGAVDKSFASTKILATYSPKASLDTLSLKGDTISTTGWYWPGQSYAHQFVFAMDARTGKEVSRVKVTPNVRNDVKSYLGNLTNSERSGFNAQIKVPIDQEVYIMVRRTNDSIGNTSGGSIDQKFENRKLSTAKLHNSLDALNLGNNVLHTSGWFLPKQNYKHQFVFVMDKETGRELKRQQVERGDRSDVLSYLGDFDGSDKTGFSTSIYIPSGKNMYVMVRRTNDASGNMRGGYEDMAYPNSVVKSVVSNPTPPPISKLRANVDVLLIDNNMLQTSGWFMPKQNYQYQFVFVMDKATGRELNRQQIALGNRSDVFAYLNGLLGSDKTGFSTSISVPSDKSMYVMVRRTNDVSGNMQGGYEDMAFPNSVVKSAATTTPLPTPSFSLTGVNATQMAWLNGIYPSIQKLAKENDLFPSIMMSQAIAESAWGQEDLAIKTNNLFGIQADATWTGARYTALTTESAKEDGKVTDYTGKEIFVQKGQSYQIYADFRKYNSQAESLTDYVTKIKTTMNGSAYRYQGVWRSNAKTYENAASALQSGGYAKDPHYAENMVNRISKYRLDTLD